MDQDIDKIFMRAIGKSAFLELSRYLGVNLLVRRCMRSKLLVLCYHGVVAEDHPSESYRYRNTVSLQQFDEQMSIVEKLFNPISAQTLINFMEGKEVLPPSPVLITFDDGFRNNLLYGAPVLERHGIPALFHVTTGYIGQQRCLWPQELFESVLQWSQKVIPLPGDLSSREMPAHLPERIALADEIRGICKCIPDEDRRAYLTILHADRVAGANDLDEELYEFLSWDEVRELARRGFEIGSHTVEHPILTRLEGSRLKYELYESKSKIEQELGADCRALAYPNGGQGDFSAEVITRAKESGYKLAFTLTQQFNSPGFDPYALSRVSIAGQVSSHVFHSRISGLYSLMKNW